MRIISFSYPKEYDYVIETLRKLAAQEDRSISQVIRIALKDLADAYQRALEPQEEEDRFGSDTKLFE